MACNFDEDFAYELLMRHLNGKETLFRVFETMAEHLITIDNLAYIDEIAYAYIETASGWIYDNFEKISNIINTTYQINTIPLTAKLKMDIDNLALDIMDLQNSIIIAINFILNIKTADNLLYFINLTKKIDESRDSILAANNTLIKYNLDITNFKVK